METSPSDKHTHVQSTGIHGRRKRAAATLIYSTTHTQPVEHIGTCVDSVANMHSSPRQCVPVE